MNTGIHSLTEAAKRGDWGPLIEAARQAPGKRWAENAKCAGQDTRIFVLTGDEPDQNPDLVKKRKGIRLNHPLNFCAACPLAVSARCLLESLQLDDEYGIRAGLLASERTSLRAAWQRRVDSNAVSAAVRGATHILSEAERDEVVAAFSSDPSLSPARVARGLGVTHEQLLKLVRKHRKSSSPASAASATHVAAA